MFRIDSIRTLTLGKSAQTVRVSGLAFLAQNLSASANVFFRERRADGTDADSTNGWRLGPGESTPLPLTALELSLAASAEGTDVRVMILED